jgi:mannosidase alpha-like ER degradation enhancer 2
MFDHARKPIRDYLEHGGWYFWGTMARGAITMPVFQSLEAYWPGVLSLTGDIDSAMAAIRNYRQVWKQFGFTPEFYNIPAVSVVDFVANRQILFFASRIEDIKSQ